ncbi:hypothetical protein NE237_004562 [Protea cynaroides]|uniref:FAF domain-containing protein n=1 Tax=Protea cynaroides TaxID=273540 RepID=A0A9Q0KIV2_9MAGN|nr:hypothetical protein NE237_004562 [Protea cynaroides]
MSTSISRGLLRRMEEEGKTSQKQGIGSILGSESEKPKTAASLRRTLSADMSSKKWFGRHGFTPLKKIPSSESFPVISSDSSSSSSSEGEEDERQFDNWSSIFKSKDEEQQKKGDLERPGLSDIWGSILSQKSGDSSKSSSAPYIHPLMKRSKSLLSQKSLEVCTESLGSETGSEGFSSYPSSETSNFEDKSAEEEQSTKETEELSSQTVTLVKEKEELEGTRKSLPRSFPPPLPSLARREGPGFLMQSHRRDGRLVLEAVPVASYNYFQAERHGGRLRLNFINKASAESMETDDDKEEEEEEEVEKEVEADVFDEFQGFEEEDENEKEKTEIQLRGIVTEVMNVHRSAALLTNKLMGFTNKKPTWPSYSHKKNVDMEEDEEAETEEEEEEEVEEDLTQLPKSLPCPPRMARLRPSPTAAAAGAASFNAYDYFWRTKPTAAAAAIYPLNQQPPLPPPPPIIDNNNYYSYSYINKHKNISCNNKIVISNGLKPQEQQKQRMVLRDNEVDFWGGCKEPRTRSLFIWQPTRCIATS